MVWYRNHFMVSIGQDVRLELHLEDNMSVSVKLGGIQLGQYLYPSVFFQTEYPCGCVLCKNTTLFVLFYMTLLTFFQL